VHRLRVRVGVHGHRLDAHRTRGLDHATGDFASVCDKDFLEGGVGGVVLLGRDLDAAGLGGAEGGEGGCAAHEQRRGGCGGAWGVQLRARRGRQAGQPADMGRSHTRSQTGSQGRPRHSGQHLYGVGDCVSLTEIRANLQPRNTRREARESTTEISR
jgi:hypothetical protein